MKQTRRVKEQGTRTSQLPPGGWPWAMPQAIGGQTVIIIADRVQTEQILRTILQGGRGIPQ